MQVLVVEPNALYRRILHSVFTQAKMCERFVATASEAIAALRAERFDLISVALHLDDGDGMALTQRLRALPEYRNTPVIMLTAEDRRATLEECLRAGVTEVFAKSNLDALSRYLLKLTRKGDGSIFYFLGCPCPRRPTLRPKAASI